MSTMPVRASRMFEEEGRPGDLAVTGATGIVEQGGTLQRAGSQWVTAVQVQRPRNLREVERNLMEEAALAGETMYYGWGAGKDRIEGPSIELATAIHRCLTNNVVDQGPVEDFADGWVFSAVFIDLERGTTLTRKFRQSKRWIVYGKMDANRQDDIRFQIGQSKAIRNVILCAVPEWLVNKAISVAKEGVINKIQTYIDKHGVAAAQDYALNALAKCGVKEDRVLAKFERAERKGLTVEDLAIIKGDITVIENGAESPQSLYPAVGPEKANESLKEKVAAQKAKLQGETTTISSPAGPEEAAVLPTAAAAPTQTPAPSLLPPDAAPGQEEIDAEVRRDAALAALRVLWSVLSDAEQKKAGRSSLTNVAKGKGLSEWVQAEFKQMLAALDESRVNAAIDLLKNRQSTETADKTM